MPEVMAFSEGAIRNNAMVVEYCRTSMGKQVRVNVAIMLNLMFHLDRLAALGGGAAGILGLTSLYGFAFYLFCAVAIWVIERCVKCKTSKSLKFVRIFSSFYCWKQDRSGKSISPAGVLCCLTDWVVA